MEISKELLSLIKKYQEDDSLTYVCSSRYLICPGLCDVHVHFREPGFSYKETILTGSKAASRGGYTDVCTMPNLNPCPDSLKHLQTQLDIIKRDAVINVIPYGTITKNQDGKELIDMEAISSLVVGYSDDGKGVTDKKVMLEAFKEAKKINKVIAAHCEDKSLITPKGCIHDGKYAKMHHLPGISSESEYQEVKKDIALLKEVNAPYHVCHISTKESVALIKKAKQEGLNITCETAPHYLLLNEEDLLDDGDYKMNPPLRSKEDQQALIKGIQDGTVDMIATDHAPHSIEEKSRGLLNSAFGIVGLETSFPLLYTELVKKGVISINRLMELMVINPRKRFSIPINKTNYAIFELASPFKINKEEFFSKGRSTPFNKKEVYGKCILTVYKNKIIYQA